MNPDTTKVFVARIHTVAEQYLKEVQHNGYNSTKASMLYDEIFHIAEMANDIEERSKQEKEVDEEA